MFHTDPIRRDDNEFRQHYEDLAEERRERFGEVRDEDLKTMATINAGGVKKVRVLVESKVVVEPGHYRRFNTEEERALYLERWSRDFEAFIRDHRHQDVNAVKVERVYQQQCSKCHYEWEEMKDEDGDGACAYCGEKMEVVR